MLSICEDIIIQISEFLSDREKIQLMATSKLLDNLKHKFTYCDKINIIRIYQLPYFDNFECVQISSTPYKYPKNIKHIYYESLKKFTGEGRDIYDIIPSSVTYLTLGWSQFLCIPVPSVTHLTLYGHLFIDTIKFVPSVTHLRMCDRINAPLNCIPSSVTHLTLGFYFNKSIKDKIPSSVTHLIFGDSFNKPIKYNIPSSVTHLTFGYYFDQLINDSIPSSVVEIILSKTYRHEIRKDLLAKVIIH